MKRINFTQEGFDKLLEEQQNLIEERKKTIVDLQKAREMGDLSENGFYKATKHRLGEIDHRLDELKLQISYANIVSKTSVSSIQIGSSVKLQSAAGEHIFHLVGDMEANPTEKKISLRSPIGKALHGKKAGEVVEIITPSGTISYTVISIL